MVFLVFVFAIAAGFIALALVRWTRPDESDGDGGSDEGGHGRGWRGPRPRPRGPEPAWWPEFERDFRAYVKRQETRAPMSTVGS
jgi:hypothetical protein